MNDTSEGQDEGIVRLLVLNLWEHIVGNSSELSDGYKGGGVI